MSCYRYEEHWFVRDRHNTGCDDPECSGCEVCHRHCTCRPACAEHIDPDHPITAPACVGRTRTDIGWIVTLASLMLPEAIVQGIDSEPAALAGPVADVEAWEHRKASALAGRKDHISLLEDDDKHHPLVVLGRWTLRLHLTQPGRATVTRHATWILNDLTRIAQAPDGSFRDLRRDARACRDHLEAVLHDSRTPELGVPCPECQADIAAHGETRKAPRLRKKHFDADTTGARDMWQCPAVEDHWWKEADYRLRVGNDYLANAVALTAAELHTAYGIKPSTVRTWAQRGLVKKRGRNGSGQQMYDVAQARAQQTEEVPA